MLDLTFNTDFAQADADLLINNINRFSVFFPEKRQFFLENAGLFSVGMDPIGNQLTNYSTRIQPFFSRAIGLDANGSTLNIDAGARLVYRSDKVNAGGLFIRQAGNAATNPANFFVGRYSQNFGSQNRIGALISLKSADDKGAVAGRKNFTGTIDGFLRLTQALSESFMGSVTADFKGKTGYSGSSQLYYNSNGLVAWLNESIVDSKYDPQMGFVARGNAIVTDPGFYLQERGKWLPGFIRLFEPGMSVTTYHDATTLNLTDRYLTINPILFQFQGGGIVLGSIIFNKQNLENDFMPLSVVIKRGVIPIHSITFPLAAIPLKSYQPRLPATSASFIMAATIR